MSYKRTAEGKRVTLAYKARRLAKYGYAVRPLDVATLWRVRDSRHSLGV
jgi:hypothetical protein